MKTLKLGIRCALCAGWLLAAHVATAADVKAYQVTGPVLEVTPTSITVQKGDEKWQVARDAKTKMTVEPKVGDKVVVHYKMIATEVESKTSAPASKDKK